MRKLTFEEVKNRIEQIRNDIILCEDGFKGWKKKSKFLDNEYGEFWAKPENVFNKKSAHPKKGFLKRNKNKIVSFETAKERFSHRDDIVLCKDAYVSFNKKAKFWDRNVQEYFWAIPDSVLRQKSSHPSKRKEKYKATCLKKYGVEHHTQSSHYEKFKYRNCSILIEDTGEWFKKWYDKQSEPKPAYTTIVCSFEKQKAHMKDLESFFENYKNNKTKLEVFCENIFDTKHFNKKPNQIQKFYKPDFYLGNNVYVNVNGLWWHREKKVGKWYHFNLRKEFEETGLRLFQFHEPEIYDKTEIIKSIVNSSFNKFDKIINNESYEIRNISNKTAKIFLDDNHLKGYGSVRHIGLYYNNLVSLMSYRTYKNICKIERFCSVLNTNVVGGFSKLLEYLENDCINTNTTEIHNWTDLRYETGNHLENNRFVFVKDKLDYKWTNGKVFINKNHFKKQVQKKHWYKIYNAGERLWVKYKNTN